MVTIYDKAKLLISEWQSEIDNQRVYFEGPTARKTGFRIGYDGIPFIHLSESVLWCHQGPDRSISFKRRRKEKADAEDVRFSYYSSFTVSLFAI